MGESARTLTIGLAGHVDHGKTSLVRALTGTDTDRLEEERRRGLTIELGFAHRRLPDGSAVSFIDVPGHERFVRTMASGVSGIDAAMLVVDAREGVRAQTREHADILRILGVRHVLAVVSKIDRVGRAEIAAVERETASLLGPALHASVACSAVTGEGIERIPAALATLPPAGREPPGPAPFRMPIDRAFPVRGAGMVVTGTVWQGTVRVGDALERAPAGGTARVRAIETRGERVGSAGPGRRTALNLAVEGGEPTRGDELVEPGRFLGSRRLTVDFELLGASPRPIRSGARVLVMLGTRAEPASVRIVEGRTLEPGGRGLVQLQFGDPVIATGGQPLIVRAGSPETTIGGGVVRSVFAPGLGRADAGWHERLRALDGASPSRRLEIAAWGLGERSWPGAMAHQEAGAWGPPTPGVAFAAGRIDPARLEALADRVRARVEAVSDGGVVERSRVVAAVPGRAPADVLAALEHLVARGRLVEAPGGVAPPQRDRRVADEDRAAIEALGRIYEADGPAPRPADEIPAALRVRPAEARRLVRLAVDLGALVHVSGGFFVTSSVAADIEARVRALVTERGSVTVGDVRKALGVTRKHAVPICEYLDRVRVTRRVGDERVLFDEPAADGRNGR